ncbi:hypothetical protein Dimus_005592 [Dionaea muscipula]
MPATEERMVSRKKKQVLISKSESSSRSPSSGSGVRNLKKALLGGVIFGCKSSTMQECLMKQLFGLPAQHFLYVQNIDPGLPLFLFNYSDRNLHGVFEAASSGQLNIDPYGWTTDGSQRTSYPAQVQIRVQLNCQPLMEKQFAQIIKDNYYNRDHFWFELDHAQANKLVALFSSHVVSPGSSMQITAKRQIGALTSRKDTGEGIKSRTTETHFACPNESMRNSASVLSSVTLYGDGNCSQEAKLITEENQEEIIYEKLQKLALGSDQSDSSRMGNITQDVRLETDQADDLQTEEIIKGDHIESSFLPSSDFPSVVAQLMQEIEVLKAFKNDQTDKMVSLEHKLVESEIEIYQLKDRCARLEFMLNNCETEADLTVIQSCNERPSDLDDVIFLVGGYDGDSWLSSLDMYSPSQDVISVRRPMCAIRSHMAVASLSGNLFVIGGGDGSIWCDTVESFNIAADEWTTHPSLKANKASLAAATLGNKIFAIGGGNGLECFSDVEMLDPVPGRWISSRSMSQKRFSLAAAELNNVIYVAGGYDGKDYVGSAERFDPRDHSWCKIASMNSRRACHSLVVLHEKLYALGGFDGSSMVSSVEVLDPRCGTWMFVEPMNCSRGYSAAVVLKDSIYIIGGLKDNDRLVNTVERYETGRGWQLTNLKGIGRRCYSGALIL